MSDTVSDVQEDVNEDAGIDPNPPAKGKRAKKDDLVRMRYQMPTHDHPVPIEFQEAPGIWWSDHTEVEVPIAIAKALKDLPGFTVVGG